MKIILTDNISERAGKMLAEFGYETENLPTPTPEKLKTLLDACDAIVIRSATRIGGDLLRDEKRLKLIFRGGVGVDNIDIAAAKKCGIAVANTPGANSIATAELAFSMMLALARNLAPAHNSVQSGEWERANWRGVELFGKTLGVIGFGRIGREISKRALAFGMDALAYDPFLSENMIRQAGASPLSLDEIFRRADFITLHVPLNDETRYMINANSIEKLRDGVRIVNCARGGLIDEAAAAQALDSGKIAGLALDVYEQEPPLPENPLLGRENVLTAPHLGAYSREAQTKVADEVVDVVHKFFSEGAHPNVF